MHHLNPQWIESMLQKDSWGALHHEGAEPLPLYRFYIPYLHMPHTPVAHDADTTSARYKDYDPRQDRNGLRDDLHNFVFIQATAQQVRQIVSSEWNRRTRLRLYYYRDADGHVVTIPDQEMRSLITALQDSFLDFYFDQPVEEFHVNDVVTLQMGAWKGYPAVIKDVSVKSDGRVNLVVSVNIFQRTKSVNLKDVKVGDVLFQDEAKGRLLSGNPVNNFEEEILDILGHRFRQRYDEEVAAHDELRLKRLSSYSHIYCENPDDQSRFVALKLLCAYLRGEQQKRKRYTEEVHNLLNGQTVPATDTEAYLMMALFIVTRDPSYRSLVKDYRNTHPDCSAILRRFHAKVKELKAKKEMTYTDIGRHI